MRTPWFGAAASAACTEIFGRTGFHQFDFLVEAAAAASVSEPLQGPAEALCGPPPPQSGLRPVVADAGNVAAQGCNSDTMADAPTKSLACPATFEDEDDDAEAASSALALSKLVGEPANNLRRAGERTAQGAPSGT